MTRHISSLAQSKLACQTADAGEFKAALAVLWRLATAKHDPSTDAMEAAKLACQTRDLAEIRHAADVLAHAGRTGHGVKGGAAHA